MDIRIAAVIPARMASSRFPGKPLLEVQGLPMIEHVRRRALMCGGFAEVVVATCDREITEVVERCGGTCLMTSAAHEAASDRVAEAARALQCSHVVNVQGDEILVLPGDLSRLVRAIEAAPERSAWNAVAPIEEAAELSDRSVVKCAVSGSGRILSCSRDYVHLASVLSPPFEPLRRVLGILAYRLEFLERYLTLPRTPLETAESIDQMRIIEHDIALQGVAFTKGYPGINEPRERAVVNHYLEEDPAQRAVLEEILCA